MPGLHTCKGEAESTLGHGPPPPICRLVHRAVIPVSVSKDVRGWRSVVGSLGTEHACARCTTSSTSRCISRPGPGWDEEAARVRGVFLASQCVLRRMVSAQPRTLDRALMTRALLSGDVRVRKRAAILGGAVARGRTGRLVAAQVRVRLRGSRRVGGGLSYLEPPLRLPSGRCVRQIVGCGMQDAGCKNGRTVRRA